MPAQKTIEEKFTHLRKLVESRSFRNKEGIMHEVPFFIFPYPPSEEIQTQELTLPLFRNLENQGISILHVNLYDLCIDILKKRGVWDRLMEREKDIDKNQMRSQLQSLTDVAEHLIPEIASRVAAHPSLETLFITGVGLVYPFIRSHNLLNNLQTVAKEYPTVMFFPGEYTFNEGRGQSLDLFGVLNEDKYYRAFNILEISLSNENR